MEHLVTSITELNKKKSKVILNHEEELALYRGELRRFHIEEGEVIDDASYQEIMTGILPKRARERCLNLLAVRSMTEQEVRRKLKEGYYPQHIIDETLALMEKHHLIDDCDYAESFIQTKKKGKSKRQIQQDLMHKGVSADVIRNALEECEVDEEGNIRHLMEKKRLDSKESTQEELQKFAAYLLRKGYDYDKICKVVFH